jgi:hypothetical protein
MRATGFVFGAGTGHKEFFDSLPDNLRRTLEEWANQFADDPDANKVNHHSFMAYDIPHEAAADNIEVLAERLNRVLEDLQNLEPEGDAG